MSLLIRPGGLPTGSVTFMAGSTTLGTGTLNPGGVASFTTYDTAALAAGNHPITATYNSDGNFATSRCLSDQCKREKRIFHKESTADDHRDNTRAARSRQGDQ